MFKTTLKIGGMACGMCEAHINDCIRKDFVIQKIKTSHTSGESVIVADTVLDKIRLKSVIGDTGYVVLSVTYEPFLKKACSEKRHHDS